MEGVSTKVSKKSKSTVNADDALIAGDGVTEKKREKSKKKRSREDEEAQPESVEPEQKDDVCVVIPPRKKPLPPGYKCNACGQEGHAIYECSLKKSKKETTDNPVPAEPVVKVDVATKIVKPSKALDIAKENGEDAVDPNLNKCYISGLPFDMTTEKLKSLFENEGCVTLSISLVMFEDNQSKCKGFGFVTFNDAGSASRAIEMTGRDMGKKTLAVVPCVTKEKPKETFPPKPTTHKGPKQPRCYRCGENHDAARCTNPRICYRCRASDHISSQCPKKKPTAAAAAASV